MGKFKLTQTGQRIQTILDNFNDWPENTTVKEYIDDQTGDFVESTTQANKVYGTDANGNQTVYDRSAVVGGVSEVLVDGVSVVSDGTASIDLTDKADKIGILPQYSVDSNDLILDFIVNNNLSHATPIVLRIDDYNFVGSLAYEVTHQESISVTLKSLEGNYLYNITYTTDIDGKKFGDIVYNATKIYRELTGNKVPTIDSSSTNTQYPSAKCVYNELALKANVSDLSNYVDLTTNDQSISGYKKFTNGLLVENIYMSSPSNPKRQVLKFGYANEITTFYQTLIPDTNCRFEHSAGQIFEYGRDIGSQSFKFKHLFLGGYVNKNSSGFGLVFPDTTSFTANKTIATLADIPSNPQVVQNLTTNTAVTLNSVALASLKSTHYAVVSSPVMTGLDSAYEFVNVKFSIDSTNYIVKLSKNDTNKYAGMFFIEGTGSLYELTVYYNGTNMIFRCATVYENVQ